MRTPHYFKEAEARDKAHLMTELVGDVRKMRVTNKGAVNRTVSSLETLVHYKGSRPPTSPPVMIANRLTTRDTRYAAEEGPWKRLESECPSVPLKLPPREWVKATINIGSQEAY